MAPAIRVALPPELSPPERLPPHLTASGEPMMDESRLAMAMDWTLYPARGPLTTDVALNYIGQVLRPDKAEAIAPVSVETIIVEPDIQEITDSEIAASEIAASEIPVHEQSDGAIMAALETTPDGVSEAALGEPSVVSVPLASVFISPVAAQLDPSLIQVAALPSVSAAPAFAPAPTLSEAYTQIAQTAKEDSVSARSHADFDPLGIELDKLVLPPLGSSLDFAPGSFREALGSIVVLPVLEVSEFYDDNIFRTENTPKSDRVTTVKPSLDFRSEWANHYINIHGDMEWGFHEHFSGENYADFDTYGTGRLDVGEYSKVTLDLGHKRQHEQRGSPDDLGPSEAPTIYFESYARGASEFDNDLILIRASAEAKQQNYRNSGDTYHDDRDNNEYTGIARLGYEFYPGTMTFVEGTVISQKYVDMVDEDGYRRDSYSYEVQMGFTYDVSGVSFLEASVGWLDRQFLSPLFPENRIKPVQGLAFDFDLVWNATDVLTLTSSGGRSIEETTNEDTSSILQTESSFQVDYEYEDNIILDLSGSYKLEDYQGIVREDTTYTGGLGMRYLVSQYAEILLDYDWSKKLSNNEDSGYTDNLITAVMKLKM